MRILFLTSGSRVPSARFRILAYLPYLRSAGHQCSVAASFPQKYDYFPAFGFRPSQALKRLVRWWHLLCAWVRRYDVVVIERELFDAPSGTMEARFRRAAGTLVLDVDDAIFLTYPEKFEQLAGISDVIIAGNRFLKQRIESWNSNVVVIPTCVDTRLFSPKQFVPVEEKIPVIGWIGTTANLAYLEVVAPALRSLAERCRFSLRLVAGDDEPLRNVDLRGVDVRFVRWSPDTEVDAILEFDIGIMPLFADSEWDEYKCGFKLLQYMAAGIPGVASPVGVNSDIVQHAENGFLADTRAQWEEILLKLVTDTEVRRRVGQHARRSVEDNYSIDRHFSRFVETLQAAIARQRVDQI